MFTGIIDLFGKVLECEQRKEFFHIAVQIKKTLKGVKLGSSIAINGVCLTVYSIKNGVYSFHVLEETRKKTALGDVVSGQLVHVELSLKVGDEIGGHFVYGHGDGVGIVKEYKKISKKTGSDVILTIQPPKKLMKFFVLQGSVVVNGVSLTIARLTHTTFTVCLVPFTLEKTLFSSLKKGDRLNIECDMIAKYVLGYKK